MGTKNYLMFLVGTLPKNSISISYRGRNNAPIEGEHTRIKEEKRDKIKDLKEEKNSSHGL